MSTNTTPLYTPESVDEALLILDNATASASTMTDVELLLAIDMAAQKLRGVKVSPEDAELVQLARKHPIELPWMQEQRCTVPPEGWECSRTPGHDGPCAARRVYIPLAECHADPRPVYKREYGPVNRPDQGPNEWKPRCRDCDCGAPCTTQKGGEGK